MHWPHPLTSRSVGDLTICTHIGLGIAPTKKTKNLKLTCPNKEKNIKYVYNTLYSWKGVDRIEESLN